MVAYKLLNIYWKLQKVHNFKIPYFQRKNQFKA